MVPFPPLVRSPQFASDHATTPQFARAIDRGERGREAGSPGHARKGCRSTDDGKVLPREEATHRRLASVRSSLRSSVTESGRCCVASALCTPLPQSLLVLSSCIPAGAFNFPRQLRCGALRGTPSASTWPTWGRVIGLRLRADLERSGPRMDGQLTLSFHVHA